MSGYYRRGRKRRTLPPMWRAAIAVIIITILFAFGWIALAPKLPSTVGSHDQLSCVVTGTLKAGEFAVQPSGLILVGPGTPCTTAIIITTAILGGSK